MPLGAKNSSLSKTWRTYATKPPNVKAMLHLLSTPTFLIFQLKAEFDGSVDRNVR